jgi:hypothetical protein
MGKKITQLATITEVADDDLIVGVDVSDTSGSDNGTNKKFTKATLLTGLAPLNPQLTGWNPDAETWVYHNVDDPTGYFKIAGKDVSANYSVGWRIMFTNGGNVIKGIITAITYSDPDTIITFLHEIDPTDNQALYLLQNSAITENYVSPHKAPLGFPMSPAKWSVVFSTKTQVYQASPSVGTVYSTGYSISIPIGVWDVTFQGLVGANQNGSPTRIGCALSTSTSSVTENLLRFFIGLNAETSVWFGDFVRRGTITRTSKATYYIVFWTTRPGYSNLLFGSGDAYSFVTATCAYL